MTGAGAPDFAEIDLGGRATKLPQTFLVSSSSSTSSPSPPSSPFLLATSRMSLLSSVLCDSVGGFISPVVFFPHSAWFLPSLRLPAVLQKLQALEAFHAQLEEALRAGRRGDTEKVAQLCEGLQALLATCRRLQNELAFSLTAIKESTDSTERSATSTSGPLETFPSPDGAQVEGLSEADGAAADSGDTVSASTPSTSSSAASAAVDRLSSRVKALGYSLAKSAHRMSKSVLADRMSREQAELYLIFIQRIDTQLHSLVTLYQAASNRGKGETVDGEVNAQGAEDAQLVAAMDAVGVFVCEVLVVLIVDDVQRAMMKFLTEQQEALNRGVRGEEGKRRAQKEDLRGPAETLNEAAPVSVVSSAVEGATPAASALRVLFLCRSNSCRSQMAEGWAHHLHSPSVLLPFSAGLLPPKPVDPLAILVMDEAGVSSLHQAKSKYVDDLDKPGSAVGGADEGFDFDVVVTLCDTDACAVFEGRVKLLLHHTFDDPPHLTAEMGEANHEEQVQVYRRVRDEIKAYVQQLPAQVEAEMHKRGHLKTI